MGEPVSTLALRRRLAALEAALGEQAGRETAAAEFDALVAELDAAVAAAQQRTKADDQRRREAGLPRTTETLASRDLAFTAELGRITWRVL